jgi:hypothetical protein
MGACHIAEIPKIHLKGFEGIKEETPLTFLPAQTVLPHELFISWNWCPEAFSPTRRNKNSVGIHGKSLPRSYTCLSMMLLAWKEANCKNGQPVLGLLC